MYKCYIVDDEPAAIEVLSDYIESSTDLELVKAFTNPLTAFDFIVANSGVDIIFLDIEMPELNGISFLNLIRDKTKKIVLVTGHPQYDLEAIELKADGYLLKPFSQSRFDRLVESIFADQSLGALNESIKASKLLHEEIESDVSFKDVLYFKDEAKGTMVSKIDKKIVVSTPFSSVKELLSKQGGFLQVNNSMIVKLDHIKTLDGNHVILTNDEKIDVEQLN